MIDEYIIDLCKVPNISSSFYSPSKKCSVFRKKNHIESQHLSDAVLKESAFPSSLAKTEEEDKTAESFQSQDPCVKILPLEQVQGTEV